MILNLVELPDLALGAEISPLLLLILKPFSFLPRSSKMAVPSTPSTKTTEMVFSSNGFSNGTKSSVSNNEIFDACVVGAGPAGLMLR